MTHVLIVDDKSDNLYYLEALLVANGCTVESARHGAEALVKARHRPPDLVVSDLLMPVMDGYTLLRHWKTSAQLGSIPFIVYTATYTEAADEQLAMDLGADAFILKPAEPDDFMHRIEQVLANISASKAPWPNLPSGDETATLQVYSQALIRKLEEKSLQLEDSNAALRMDILARRQTEEKLRNSEALLAMASRLGRLGAWMVDLPSRQMVWSDEARAIHEVAADFVPTVVNSVDFYLPECRAALTQAYSACVQHGQPFDLELQIATFSGRIIAVRTLGEAVRDSQGQVVGVQGALQDITERKQLEERAEQVRQAQKMEAIGTLASGIAHDFNNIISIIQGNIRLAMMGLAPEHPAHKNVSAIRKAIHHARNLVQQILTFSRQQPTLLQQLAPGPLLEETMGFLRASLPARIELQHAVTARLPDISADATQIHQLLVNLCNNAAHAIGEQLGRIEVRMDAVWLDAVQAGQSGDLLPGPHVRLSISDTGMGMDEATVARIFNPFFTTKSPGKGTGLGLSVVDGIVRTHKSRISVSSRPGQGTTFQILLPASPENPQSPDNPANSASPGGCSEAQSGLGQHILYLDDNSDLVELATGIFESLGYRITGFTDPAGCLQAFAAAPGQFDLLITDLNMPQSSGLQVATQALSLKPGLRVILISGYVDDALIKIAHDVGICHVIDKTSSVENMANTIHALLKG